MESAFVILDFVLSLSNSTGGMLYGRLLHSDRLLVRLFEISGVTVSKVFLLLVHGVMIGLALPEYTVGVKKSSPSALAVIRMLGDSVSSGASVKDIVGADVC